MVRNYVPTKPRPYKKDDVTAAVEHYFDQPEGSITIKEVGEIFKIPRKTLSDHINSEKSGRKRKIGSGCVTKLNPDLEEYLVEGIITASQLGWPLNRNDIRSTVREYCLKMKAITPDSSFPAKDWMTAFKRR